MRRGYPTSPIASKSCRYACTVGGSESMSRFRERVTVIRAEYASADPADRLEHGAGRVVQCDLAIVGFEPSRSARKL
jgi:hypothetical protein